MHAYVGKIISSKELLTWFILMLYIVPPLQDVDHSQHSHDGQKGKTTGNIVF